jgi:hypothetical protein
MKKNLFQSYCLLLAGSGFSEAEISEILSFADQYGRDQIQKRIRQLRNPQLVSQEDEDYSSRYSSRSRSSIGDPLKKAEDLLRREAGLPAAVAADLLAEEVSDRLNISKSQLPPLGKGGFADWLRRLSNHVPINELLHLATIIRNRSVHAPSDVWPLKGSGDR